MDFEITVCITGTIDHTQHTMFDVGGFYSKSYLYPSRNEKMIKIIGNDIIIKIPWRFSLFYESKEVYGILTTSNCKTKLLIDQIKDELLMEMLNESYKNLCEDVLSDSYLSFTLTIIPDFSFGSIAAVQNIQSAFVLLKNFHIQELHNTVL